MPGLVNGDGVNQMVESASEIVNTIPKFKREGLEIGSLRSVKKPTMYGTMGLTLLGDSVVFRLESGLRANIEGIEVFLGSP